MSRGTQDAVVRLGQAGYVARAVVIAGIGIAALDAAVTYDAAKARCRVPGTGYRVPGTGYRAHSIAPPYAIAHCAVWPTAAVVSQPSRFDIACAQLTTARTWPESSAARHRTDHG